MAWFREDNTASWSHILGKTGKQVQPVCRQVWKWIGYCESVQWYGHYHPTQKAMAIISITDQHILLSTISTVYIYSIYFLYLSPIFYFHNYWKILIVSIDKNSMNYVLKGMQLSFSVLLDKKWYWMLWLLAVRVLSSLHIRHDRKLYWMLRLLTARELRSLHIRHET